MQVVSRPVGQGNTEEAVAWAKKDPDRVIVVHSDAERNRIMRHYSLDARQVDTLTRLRSYGPALLQRKEFIFDNIEYMLRQIFYGASIGGFTVGPVSSRFREE